MEEGTESLNGAPYEAEERCQQRDAPVHWLKQVIEEQRHSDIARGRDEFGCETQPKQRRVRQDVVRRSRGVTQYNKLAANGAIGE